MTSSGRKRVIWRDEAAETIYLVPEGRDLPSGDCLVRDLDGNTQSVDPEALAPFTAEPAQARALLEDDLAQAMEEARTAFERLRAFTAAEQEREEVPDDYFRRLMLGILGAPAPASESAVEALEAFQKHAEGPESFPKQLTELFPEEDREEVFSGVMTRLREIAGKLDASVLEERDHPAAWVEVLYRELFSDQIQTKKERQKARIQAAVSQSIADGLRSRGITPSSDLRDDDSE